ncbi:MAG TPA: DUF2892 domain-containing protein [Bacteroidia bacterium]|jgi:hypothetical protein|nr:DUF2892 domain-containing protein [Bacteroidia bacterium]HQF28280.1 DUF2892 domain-containing protein [Bacteroidia bacterium]HQK97903.1 DUF2892 domain-containing protein [Bacteroidia bacterium]
MKANLSSNDRVIRLVLGVVIASIFIYQNSALAVLGLIPFVTGAAGVCPLYSIIGFSTIKNNNA